MFQTHETPLQDRIAQDRIAPTALMVKLTDPRVSFQSKRASLEHAMRAALADGDDEGHAALLLHWRTLCGLTTSDN